jgi:hypothetical protein
MSALAAMQPVRFVARASLFAILAAAVAAAVYGAALLPGMLSGGSQANAAPTRPAPAAIKVGTLVPMTFGSLRVLEARPVTGLTNKQLGNMTHGISGLVDARDAQMTIAIEMTNSGRAALPWTAADFRLQTPDGGRMYAAIGGTRESGTLASGASVDLGLNFVVPRDGAPLVLRVRDGDQFVRVQVGRVRKAPPGTTGIDHGH